MKITILVVLIIAALEAIGVTTAVMSSTIPAHAQLYPQPFHCNAQPRTGGGSCGFTGLGGNVENRGFPFGHPTGP